MKEIVDYVSKNCSYESEYDGRMYTYCFFCDVDLGEKKHKPECLHLKAIELSFEQL